MSASDNLRSFVRNDVLATTRGKRQKQPKVTPIDPEVLAARETFIARWDALNNEGLKAGHLQMVSDSIGTFFDEVTSTATVDGWEWAETEAEHEARTEARVQIEVEKRMELMEKADG
jgi:hypothetical protein